MSGATSEKLRAVVFDWAGTTVDYGGRAPALAFVELFRARGVPITMEEARGSMGHAKRDHIAAIFDLPRVAQAWQQRYARPPHDADIEQMYGDFIPLQTKILASHTDVIPGIPEAAETCRRQGLKIGSTTGYARELMEVVIPLARAGGYSPDVVVCADDVPSGRPAPWMIFRAAEQMNVYPMQTIVIVDDTQVGIDAGRNAGTWTVAVAKTGNSLGISEAEVNLIPTHELAHRLDTIRQGFLAQGAHFVIDSVADLPTLLPRMEAFLQSGKAL